MTSAKSQNRVAPPSRSLERRLLAGLLAAKRSHPRVLALTLGSAIALMCIALVEAAFFVVNRSRGGPRGWRGPYPRGFIVRDDALGFRLKPNSRVIVVRGDLATTGQKVTYSVDGYHRRATPVRALAGRNRFALFFGGSYTFGEGVHDHQTLPCCFGELCRTYRPYNYGVPGYGPQQMLASLQSEGIVDEIGEPEGILVYTYMSHHVARAIGDMAVCNLWGAHMPYYCVTPDERLVRKGSFTTGRPWLTRFYRALGKSQTLSYFGLNLPIEISRDHILLTGRIIAEAKRTFEAKFDSLGFFTVIYPNAAHADHLVEYLRTVGVHCLDYSPIQGFSAPSFIIEHDGHPSPQAYRVLSSWIADHIRKAVDPDRP